MELERYYNMIKKLRIAQPYINDINLLLWVVDNYDTDKAISTISQITLKYENELNRIGFVMSGRPIIKGEPTSLYAKYNIFDMTEDLLYLAESVIVIATVRLGFFKNIDEAIEKLYD